MLLQFGSEFSIALAQNDALRRFRQDFGSDFCNVAVADVLGDAHYGLQKEKLDESEELLYCYSRYLLTRDPMDFRDFGIKPEDQLYLERVSQAEEKGYDVDRDWFCLIGHRVQHGVLQFPEECQEMILNHPRYDAESELPGIVIPSFFGCFATSQMLARFWEQITSRIEGSGNHAAGGKRFVFRNAPKLKADQEALVRQAAVQAFEDMLVEQLGETNYEVRFDQEHSDLIGMERGVVRIDSQDAMGEITDWLQKRGVAKRSVNIRDISGRFISIEFDEHLKAEAWRIVSEETDSLRVVSGLDEIQEIIEAI